MDITNTDNPAVDASPTRTSRSRDMLEKFNQANDIEGEFVKVCNLFDTIVLQDLDEMFSLKSSMEYFGNYFTHSSLYREDKHIRIDKKGQAIDQQKPQKDLPPYSAGIGRIHDIYRFEVPQRLSMVIDRGKLSSETQETLRDLDALFITYRKAVMATRKDISTEKLENGAIKHIRSPQFHDMVSKREMRVLNDQAKHIVKRLLQSELSKPLPIPVLVNGEARCVENKHLGLFLLGLEISERFQLDANRVPDALTMFLNQYTAGSNKIFHNMESKISDTVMIIRKRETYQALLPKIMQEFKSIGRELQIANMVQASNMTAFGRACEEICERLELDPLPQTLNTPLECALALESVAALLHKKSRSLNPLIKRFYAMHDAHSDGMTSKQSEMALNTLDHINEELQSPYYTDALRARHALILVKDYVCSPEREKSGYWKQVVSEGKTNGAGAIRS